MFTGMFTKGMFYNFQNITKTEKNNKNSYIRGSTQNLVNLNDTCQPKIVPNSTVRENISRALLNTLPNNVIV